MELDPVRLKIMALVKRRRPPTDLKNASLAMGRNAAYLHQFIQRGTPRALSDEDREALAEHLGVDPLELKHDVVPPRKSRRKPEARRPGVQPKEDDGQAGLSGFSGVPEIDVRAAAGAGAINEGFEETKETWYFPDYMLRHELGAEPGNLRMIAIYGDSMEPLLSHGDRIMIDTSHRVPVPPGIFVIWDGLGLVAKRVEHEPNSEPPVIIIKSVNPDYETYHRSADEVHVIGRVVWTGRRL